MSLISVSSSTGTVMAVVTRAGKLKLLTEGRLNVTQFALMDTEINYQLINQYGNDTIDIDDPNIIAQAIFDPSTQDRSSDYDPTDGVAKGFLLNNPYYVRNQTVVSGNRLIDNPFYVQNNEIVVPLSNLSGDPTAIFPPATSVTGSIVNTNVFYNITVFVGDQNGSVINNTLITLFQNDSIYQSVTPVNNNTTVFSNLSANQSYKVVATNYNYNLVESTSGGASWLTSALVHDQNVKFVGTLNTPAATTYTVSGTVTNAITSAVIPSLNIGIHYAGVSTTANTNGSGQYTFTVSGNTNFAVGINNPLYQLDPSVNTVTGNTDSANQVVNFSVSPRSLISGNVYFNNTTQPISNAIVSLYYGLSAAASNVYVQSVMSQADGSFVFPNVVLQKDYSLRASLNSYGFLNIPYNIPNASVTGSVTGIIIYGQKNQKPIVFDSPFPLRRRATATIDQTEFSVFYDPCSWVLYSSKIGVLGCAAQYTYSPVAHTQVLATSDYTSLIQTLSGPFQFQWNSLKNYTDTFGNTSSSAYISDNYTIKVCLYALPYQFTLANNIPQWDEFSLTEKQGIFPQQVNSNANNLLLQAGNNTQFTDLTPILENQQLAINLSDVNRLQSLLPSQQINIPFTVNSSNAIPNLGLLATPSFNIDPNILNITISPSPLAQNPDYTTFGSIQGAQKTIPTEVMVDDFEQIAVSGVSNGVVSTQTYSINGVPLPIFVFDDVSIQGQSYNNNLRFPIDIVGLTNAIMTKGIVFDKVTQYTTTTTVGQYVPARQVAYITISAVGASKTITDIYFTIDGSFYTIADEFKQFLISYFAIDINDTKTINKIITGNTLSDWLFYMMLIQYGVMYQAYANGSLQQIFTLTPHAKYALLIDLLAGSSTVVDVINNILGRQYQPSSQALSFIQSFGTNVVTTTLANNNAIQAVGLQTQTGIPTANIATANTNITSPNIATTFNPAGAVTAAPNLNNIGGIAAVGNINNINNVSAVQPVNATTNIGSSQVSPIQTAPIATVGIPVSTPINSPSLLNQYTLFSKIFADAFTNLQINFVLNSLYGFLSFDYRVKYVIVIQIFGNVTVTNFVTRPIKRLTVVTQTVTPIICRLINIVGANNYFNSNPGIAQNLKMTLQFDLSNPETIDNFLKMINYLNARLYSVYLGVEIVDNGQITQGYNNAVITTSDYVNAPIAVQKAFCLSDKVLFLAPLTIGGIQQSTTSIQVGDPTTFIGNGFIKFVNLQTLNGVASNGNVSHFIRIIRLSDTSAANKNLINFDQLSGTDYITFDVIRVNGNTNNITQQFHRFVQILDNYNYNQMITDITDLRNVLINQYANIPNVSYVGSFGPGFGNSTAGPIFWDSTYIDWPTGVTPLQILQQLFATGPVVNIGSVISNINDFTINF